MTAKPGQIARRKFDHDEARRRHQAGESIADLAREMGVTWAGMARVVDARVGRQMDAQCVRNIERRREPCRGGCGRLVWMHTHGRSGYCPRCLAEKRRQESGPQHGTENEYTHWGCRCGPCRLAASEAKRQRRLRTRVPCSHGCGTLVDSINRRDNTKPPECRECVLKRVHAAQKAAAA